MSSEKESPQPTSPQNAGGEELERQESNETAVPVRPSSRACECSRSTDESVTAFIERTVSEMVQPEVESAITFPPQQGSTVSLTTTNTVFLMASVSDPIVVGMTRPRLRQSQTTKRRQDQTTVGRQSHR